MIMKKQLLLLVMMMLLPIVANADAIEVNGIYYNLIEKAKAAEVTANPNKYLGDIIIPSSIMYDEVEYNVIGIASSAFYSCNISSITIPNSIHTIGDHAFRKSSLSMVDLPNSITSIGNYAWAECPNLVSISIPNSITSIGEFAFWGCGSLTSIDLPNSITVLKKQVLSYTGLTSISIPNSVITIEFGALAGNQALETVIIPNSVTNMESYVFESCRNLKTIELSSNLYRIKEGCFKWCSNLSMITLPNNVARIEENAFYGCSSLTEIKAPNSLSTIQKKAFYGCEKLSLLELGNNISFIGDEAFGNCQALTDVYCKSINVPNTSSTAFNNSYVEYATLHVPVVSINSYKSIEPWKNFKNIVKIDMPTHTLTYVVDGETYKTYEIEEGATITPEAAPTKEGYTFSGWSEIPETMPAHDVTVTGTFTINKYKLTYYVDGEEYTLYEIEYGTSITPEVEPTKEGYTFSGWSEIPETMPAHDVTITGVFSINSYKLTYMIDDKVYKVITYEYGATITPEPQPEGDYQTFEWVDLPQTMPSHDVVVHASYTLGITEILMTSQRNIRIYAPNGKKLSKLQKGLNIVILNDGTVKKIVIK